MFLKFLLTSYIHSPCAAIKETDMEHIVNAHISLACMSNKCRMLSHFDRTDKVATCQGNVREKQNFSRDQRKVRVF